MTEPHTTISDSPNIELPLKTLLENILSFLERFVSSQEEIQLIESKLHDYESLNELLEIIHEIWAIFSMKLEEKLDFWQNSNENTNFSQEYQRLEEILQKHENQIRNHIAIEQQLRLCAETFQVKIDELSREKEDFLKEKDLKDLEIAKLKAQLFDSSNSIENLQKKMRNYEKTIEIHEKSLEDLKKKMRFRGANSEEKGLSERNHEESSSYLSPLIRKDQKNPKKLQNYGNLNLKNPKVSTKSRNFEEISFPAQKAFAEISQIYGNSLKNIFKSKKPAANNNNMINLPQSHIINMNFPRNPANLSGNGFYPNPNTSNLNINVTNLTNSLIVTNDNTLHFHNVKNPNKPRRSRSQGSFKLKKLQIGVQGFSIK